MLRCVCLLTVAFHLGWSFVKLEDTASGTHLVGGRAIEVIF